ncbi:MAG: inositol monophosphatase [Myxococcales bacterium]|nr:inositol monophosphatase [Myxococcales bacterium]
MTEEDVAVAAAQAAAAIARDQVPTGVRRKGAVDLVTATDLACERAIRDVLAQHTPDVPVLGEEEGGAADAATRWVVDPLDGTTNYVHGVPHYGVSIALQVDGQTTVGVVADVPRGLVLQATRGQGAHCDGQPLRVSDVRTLDDALCASGFPYDRRDRLDALLAPVRAVLQRMQGLRRMGAASLDLAFVAAGHFDAYFEVDLRPWDVAAGALLVEEAGGRVTPVPGRDLDRRPSPVASNGWIHEALLALISARSNLEGA